MRLQILRCLCVLLPIVASSARAGVDGQWRGTVDGTDTVLTLRGDGSSVGGTYAEGALQLQFDGTLAGDRLQGRVTVPANGMEIARLDATLRGDSLDARIDAHHPQTGERRRARSTFTRLGTATAPAGASPGTLDRSLVGTWVHEQMINSGGANFASFTTVMTMTLGADGRVQQWSRSVGGGGDWSYDSAGELQYQGRWSSEDGVLHVFLDGTDGFRPLARYRFSDQYLVTENNAGTLIWQRR